MTKKKQKPVRYATGQGGALFFDLNVDASVVEILVNGPGMQIRNLVLVTSLSYSDGFGREIQKKVQAEAGRVPKRDIVTGRIVTIGGQPDLTANSVSPRWVGNGWILFNNKSKLDIICFH